MKKSVLYPLLSMTALTAFIGIKSSYPDEELPQKPLEPAGSSSLSGAPLSNPFGGRPSNPDAQILSVDNDWNKAVSATPEPVVKKDTDQEFKAMQAQYNFEKFKQAKTPVNKFDYLLYAFESVDKKLEGASSFKLTPVELSALLRETALLAIPELQKQGPKTNLDKLMKANNLRLAMEYAGMMPDGTFVMTYAEQMTGVNATQNNEYKISLAIDASREAFPLIKDLKSVSSLNEDEIRHYLYLINIIDYTTKGSETARFVTPSQDGYDLVGIDQIEWGRLSNDRAYDLSQELRRIIQSAGVGPALDTRSPFAVAPR